MQNGLLLVITPYAMPCRKPHLLHPPMPSVFADTYLTAASSLASIAANHVATQSGNEVAGTSRAAATLQVVQL